MTPTIDAAISAGADAAYLSGSGPTVAAITSGAAGDIFLQREKERVDKTVSQHYQGKYYAQWEVWKKYQKMLLHNCYIPNI